MKPRRLLSLGKGILNKLERVKNAVSDIRPRNIALAVPLLLGLAAASNVQASGYPSVTRQGNVNHIEIPSEYQGNDGSVIYLSSTPSGAGVPVAEIPAGTASADLPHGVLNYDENQYYSVAAVNNGEEGTKSPAAGAFTFVMDRDNASTIPPYENAQAPDLEMDVIEEPCNGISYFTHNLNKFATDADNVNQDLEWTLNSTNLWNASIDENGVLRARGSPGIWSVTATVSDGEFSDTDTTPVVLGYKVSGRIKKPFVDPEDTDSGLEGAVVKATKLSNGQYVLAETNNNGYFEMILPWTGSAGATSITMVHPFSDNYADTTISLNNTNMFRTKNITAEPEITNQEILHLSDGTVYWKGSEYPLNVDVSEFSTGEQAAVKSLFQHLITAYNSLAASQSLSPMNIADYFTFTSTADPSADIHVYRSNFWGADWDNDVDAHITKAYIWTNMSDYLPSGNTWTTGGFNSGTEEVLTTGGFGDIPTGLPGGPWGGESNNVVPIQPLEAWNWFLKAYMAKFDGNVSDYDNFSEQTATQKPVYSTTAYSQR
ncbi:MAG: hypothetical protein V1659_03015 [Candidatus Woesearchaeota archaeon]